MKKRIFSLLLLLGTVLSLFPVQTVMAEEILPKDETPGAAETIEEDDSLLSVYDKLYVGADGSATANGGHLIGLYTAYAGDTATVTLSSGSAGAWKNKMDDTGATDAILRDTYATKDWVLDAKGGVGYHMNAAEWQAGVAKMGITMPDAWAELPNFTVEQAASLDGIDHTQALSAKQSTIRLDLLLGLWLPATSMLKNSLQDYCWRWSYGVYQDWANTLMATQEYAHRDAYVAAGNKPVGIVSSYDKTTSADGVSYFVSHNLGGSYGGLCYTTAEYAAVNKTIAFNDSLKVGNARPIFSVMNGAPGTTYALRVYDAALTTMEKNHNAVVDIMAASGIDPTQYMSLNPTVRNLVATVLATKPMETDVEEFNATVKAWADVFDNPVSLEDSLYVMDGLTLFTAAYNSLNSGSFETSDGLNWINMIDNAAPITLRGQGWHANAKGGYTIIKNVDQFLENRNFGLYLPASALPRRDYTVEFVYNPTGITQTGENGELEHYIDTITANGLYTQNDDSLVIGPLRAFQFSSYRPAAQNLERRWHYHATSIWLGHQVGDYWEKSTWADLDIDQIVTYSITHNYNEGAPIYEMFNDLTKCMGMEVSAAEYKTPDQAKNAFRFLIGVAGTAYCVRVYDRVLTKAEMAQNHVADLFYYYGIDRSLLDNCLVGMEDNSELIYGAFGDIGFDLTPEEAKSAITKKVAAIWLTYDGLAIRRDGKDALRYYFSVTPEAVSALAAAGARVELGALVNVGKGMAPIIDGDAYDYKIVTYDSVAGKHAPFYVDEDTFAVTVKYENADRATSLSEINVCGYVKVTYANGETVVFYTDAASPTEIENTLFGVYDRMKVHDGVKKDSLLADQVKNRIEACYERVLVHVQAGAAVGGDGSAEKPYHSFAQGFNKCKELFATAGKPINVILYLGDGEYGIYEKQTLTAADMPYTYSKLEITSKNGKSTLTTTKNLTESFTKYADNVWFCQLEKENGAYPSFRYLYVDGVMADLSYSGARYSYDEGHYVSGFERDYDGPWGKCYELYKAGLLRKDSGSGYPAYRTDLIASFESYKTRFLALMEMERLYAAKSLTIDTQAKDFSDDAYVAAFEELKLWRIALDDLKAQNEEKNRGKDYNASLSAFKKFTASPEYAGNAAYEAMLISIRDQIANLSSTSLVFGSVTPRITTTAIAEGKYYLPLEMVGDLTAALVEGKAQAKAKYQTLLAAYNAADAAGKEAMKDELDAAALRASDESRYRYALEGKGLELHHAGQWWYNILHITGIDYEDTAYDSEYNEHVAVYLDVEEYASFHVHKTYSMKGRYVHLKNALDYVDSESEYFYDETTGKLYYYSESGVEGKTFARGTSDYMFWFEGIKEVTVSDLEITGVDDNHLSHNHGCYGLGGVVGTDNTLYYDRSAIRLRDCFGLTVVNCNFHDLGARAIHGDGKLENIYIESNVFTRLGAGAVHFGAGSLERNWNYATNYIEDVVISDNYAHDISREYYSDSVIWLHYGKDVDITHNTVDLCSYTAISVGWNFNTPTWTPGERYQMYNVNISNNYLTGFMHEIGDGGGIYVSGGNAPKDWTENFNYIRENFVLLNNVTGNGLGHFLVGIYFDGSTSNWLCSNNVVTEQSYGAVPGEDDDLYESGDPYVTALRNRYTGTVFIYLQHIVVQITHNILCENNFILNVRATTPEAQKQEVYRNYVVAERNLREVNTVYVTSLDRIPLLAEEIIYAAGCYGHEGDPTILYDNNY